MYINIFPIGYPLLAIPYWLFPIGYSLSVYNPSYSKTHVEGFMLKPPLLPQACPRLAPSPVPSNAHAP